MPRFYGILKRGMDLGGASLGLMVTAPILAVAALLIKLTGPGPVFFGQERLGRDGSPFTTWKLRTMVRDASSRGALVTAEGDPRVTPVGRFLRATKLDELPQLWNVLRGEMSLVGPRPEVARYAAFYPQEFEELLRVRPGITDRASLLFRHEEELLASAADPEREYIERILPRKIVIATEDTRHPSLRRDLLILVRTLWVVVCR